jgi:hypothetical protein
MPNSTSSRRNSRSRNRNPSRKTSSEIRQMARTVINNYSSNYNLRDMTNDEFRHFYHMHEPEIKDYLKTKFNYEDERKEFIKVIQQARHQTSQQESSVNSVLNFYRTRGVTRGGKTKTRRRRN